MTPFRLICFNFLIFGCIWQLIIIQRVNSFQVTVNQKEIESQIENYMLHLNKLKEAMEYKDEKGSFWRKLFLMIRHTEICRLKKAQLFTLCQWIANSKAYARAEFTLVRIKRFLRSCYPQYFRMGDKKDQLMLGMVTCPYIKKSILDSGLDDKKLLSRHPGVLFLSGSKVPKSALVFISHLQNNEVVIAPYGYVPDIDMEALEKVKKLSLSKVVEKAIEANAKNDDPSAKTKDSDNTSVALSARETGLTIVPTIVQRITK